MCKQVPIPHLFVLISISLLQMGKSWTCMPFIHHTDRAGLGRSWPPSLPSRVQHAELADSQVTFGVHVRLMLSTITSFSVKKAHL